MRARARARDSFYFYSLLFHRRYRNCCNTTASCKIIIKAGYNKSRTRARRPQLNRPAMPQWPKRNCGIATATNNYAHTYVYLREGKKKTARIHADVAAHIVCQRCLPEIIGCPLSTSLLRSSLASTCCVRRLRPIRGSYTVWIHTDNVSLIRLVLHTISWRARTPQPAYMVADWHEAGETSLFYATTF